MNQSAAPASRYRLLKIIGIALAALFVLGLLVQAFGGGEDEADEPTTSTPTPSPEPTTEPEPTPEPTTEPAAEPATAAVTYPIDRWADVVDPAAEWAPWVVTADQTEENRLVVTTLISDPRGADGSEEALRAIAICEAAVAALEGDGVAEPHVSVMESDDTTFVIYGHPTATPGECTEV